MKQIILFLFVLAFGNMEAQILERVQIKGQIISKDNDIEGITIFNKSSNKGTLSDTQGEFTIKVAENDILEISALQFTPQTITITNLTLQTGILKIFLAEKVNSLNEVLVFSSELTGNLEVDVDSVKIFQVDPMGSMSMADIRNYNFPIDHLTKVDNTIMRQGQYYNMVNFMALFDLLKKNDKKPIPKYAALEPDEGLHDISDKYSHDFITTQFAIPENQVESFYAYCYEKGFDAALLNSANEVYLLEYMANMSKAYLDEHNIKK